MPSFYSNIGTEQNKQNAGDRWPDGQDITGSLVNAIPRYALVGTEVANDLIYLCRLPASATIDPALSYVYCDDPGTTLTLDIGDTTDPDRYADGIVLSAGGKVLFDSIACDASKNPFTNAEDRWLIATVASAASLTPAAVLQFHITFSYA